MTTILNVIEHFKFIAKKPRVMLKIFNGYFNAMILKKDVLRTIDWGIIYGCNFRCEMCSAFLLMRNEENRKKKVLTVEQIRDVWKQAGKLGVIHVNITGGEPMLRGINELCQIVRNFEPNKFLISMVTNGSLVKEDDIIKLKEAGLDTLQLSLDSSDPATHDKIRNHPGSYNKVIQCLQWAKKHGLIICISTVLKNDNFEDIEKLVEFTKKEGVFLLLNPISSSGAIHGKEEKKLMEEHLEKYNKLLKIPHVRADTVLNFRGPSGCPAGTERIEITAYGEVMTCPHVQITYGNVLNEPLEKIYKRMAHFPPLQYFSPVCKHAFDEGYKESMLRPLNEINQLNLPLPIWEHPTVKNDENLRKALEN